MLLMAFAATFSYTIIISNSSVFAAEHYMSRVRPYAARDILIGAMQRA